MSELREPTDDELLALFEKAEWAAKDTRAARRALYEAGEAAALARRARNGAAILVPPDRIHVQWWRDHVSVQLKPFAILDGAWAAYVREP